MKNLSVISLIILCLFCSVAAKASVNDEKINDNDPEVSKDLRPSESEVESLDAEPELEELAASESAAQADPDSTNFYSVSKFNFIFYFIYKLKYDEDGNAQGYLDYGL